MSMVGWIVLGVIVIAAVVGFALLMRSLKRWTPIEGSDPESRQAQARLWATRNMSSR